jgi:hypothetical protein
MRSKFSEHCKILYHFILCYFCFEYFRIFILIVVAKSTRGSKYFYVIAFHELIIDVDLKHIQSGVHVKMIC